METKILSINMGNICIDVNDDFELNDQTINKIVKQIKEMFQDNATLKDHITTIYDDNEEILYHVQDGKITHSQTKEEIVFETFDIGF